ncbi:MAG: rhodanese-like domain-containing protein [Tissierellia bacterium]|nr:rhodanese-like domain-containing protein [Tissierellia bacterium]
MKLMKKMLPVALMVALFAGCSNQQTNTNTDTNASNTQVESSSNAQNTEVKEMTGDQLAKIEADNKEKEKYLVIDVRDEEEYDKGHITHAINISVDDIKEDLNKIEDYKDKSVVLYCNTGNRSGEAAKILVENGFKDVYNAEGVKEYDYELVTFESVLAEELQEAANEADNVIIDVRDKKDYDKGHLKSAISIPLDEAETKINELDVDKDADIYTYCYSGNKSKEVAQMLTEAGFTNVHNSLDGTKEFDFESVQD